MVQGMEQPPADVPSSRNLKRSVEAVEDEVEPVLVLAAVVVAGPEHVLEGELGQVRVLLGGELREHGLGEFGGLLAGVERQARFLQREAVDVTVKGRVGVGSQRDREARTPEAPEDSVVMA